MLFVPGDPGPAQRFLGARRGGLRPAELALERVDDALLLRRQAHLVRGEPRLVPFGLDDALGAE